MTQSPRLCQAASGQTRDPVLIGPCLGRRRTSEDSGRVTAAREAVRPPGSRRRTASATVTSEVH
eukprot:224426-Hanusia_phi.AAC.1